jgi:hypothetical protein
VRVSTCAIGLCALEPAVCVCVRTQVHALDPSARVVEGVDIHLVTRRWRYTGWTSAIVCGRGIDIGTSVLESCETDVSCPEAHVRA